jgi:hypothetical protein
VYLRLNAPAPRGSINADLSSLRRPAVDDFGSKCVELGDGLLPDDVVGVLASLVAAAGEVLLVEV